MFNRKEIIYHGDEIVSETLIDVDWTSIRKSRKNELSKCDYMFLSDQTPSQEWVDYRQFLRDLPQNYETSNEAADAWNEYPIPE